MTIAEVRNNDNLPPEVVHIDGSVDFSGKPGLYFLLPNGGQCLARTILLRRNGRYIFTNTLAAPR